MSPQARASRPFSTDSGGAFPRSRAIVERILQGIPEEEKVQIAGGNSAKLYHFDAVY
jgi:hypothetical protein